MIGAIEQKLLDTVEAVSGTGAGKLGYIYKTIESYGNQLTAENLKSVAQSFPAVLALYGGERKPEEAPGGALRRFPTFILFFGQLNRRNEEAARRGQGSKPGTYQMIEDARAVFFRNDLGLAIEPIIPGAVRSIMNANHMSVYALELHTSFLENPSLVDANALDDFSTFHADWDVAPHGNVTTPLPAAEADASDTLDNLET